MKAALKLFCRMQGTSTIWHFNYRGAIYPLKKNDPLPRYTFSDISQNVFKSQGANVSEYISHLHLIGQGDAPNASATALWKTTILPSGVFIHELKKFDMKCSE